MDVGGRCRIFDLLAGAGSTEAADFQVVEDKVKGTIVRGTSSCAPWLAVAPLPSHPTAVAALVASRDVGIPRCWIWCG